MVLTFTVPASRRGSYLPGQLVQFGYAVYRVMDATHERGTFRVTAVRFTTVAQYDALWAGKTIAQHDAFWAGRRCLDASIRPLWTPYTPAGVDLFLPTFTPEFPGGGPSDDPRPFLRRYPSESKWGD